MERGRYTKGERQIYKGKEADRHTEKGMYRGIAADIRFDRRREADRQTCRVSRETKGIDMVFYGNTGALVLYWSCIAL
jgi:hypothetical protein